MVSSINIPENEIQLWRAKSRPIRASTAQFLHRCLKNQPRKSGGIQYNRGHKTYSVISVRWENDEYENLRAIAIQLRLSISLLVYRLIQFWKKSGRSGNSKQIICNRKNHIVFWGGCKGEVTEIIEFEILSLSSA